MKKFLSLLLAVVLLAVPFVSMTSCSGDKIIVQTNAFFAPFEYYDGTEIKGVDVEIMKQVGEKLGREVEFVNVEFSAIIDNVEAGKVCDCGAAGITITDERLEKVNFSTPYYTSVQYVIYAKDNAAIATKNGQYIVWDALAGMKLGVQTDTTGMIYADGEINGQASNPEYGFDGVLYGTNTQLKCFDSAQLAADGIGANQIDAVIVDELPAKYIAEKSSNLVCLPLYYAGGEGEEDSPVEEEYAICVNKDNAQLLTAINEVLADLLKDDGNGQNEIEKLIMKHMGLA